MIHHGCTVRQGQEEAWREVRAGGGQGKSCLQLSRCRPCCHLVQDCPSLPVSSRRARAHTHACSRRHTEARMPCSPPCLALCISFLKQKHPDRASVSMGSGARATVEEARCVDGSSCGAGQRKSSATGRGRPVSCLSSSQPLTRLGSLDDRASRDSVNSMRGWRCSD